MKRDLGTPASGARSEQSERSGGQADSFRRYPASMAMRSLWLRVVLVVLVVELAPIAFLGASSWYDARVSDRLVRTVEFAANRMLEILQEQTKSGRGEEELAQWVEAVAKRGDAWVRVLDANGTVLADVDYDGSKSPFRHIRDWLFGVDGAPTLREFDRTRGELIQRPEIARARASQRDFGCEYSPGGKLLACGVAVIANIEGIGERIIYVRQSSRRPIRALYDLRFQLLRLMLFVLPLALILAWWLGWRIVRPLDRLRAQVLAKMNQPAPAADLAVVRLDEIGQVAFAFNALLDRLAERTRANEAFVQDLTHEFKNPVAAIRACVDALGTGSVDATRAERLARVLRDSSQRLDALVTQLLELARAESGMRDEPRAPVDLAAIVRGVVGVMREDERWREVSFEVSGDEQAVLYGVSTRIESVVRNLLDNAASHSGPGGKVTVSIRRNEAQLALAVTDSGPGIPAGELPRVFERFYTTRGERRGTGLGLALVRAIVEAHGGQVSATSEPGAGATFHVTLPAAP